MVNDGRHAYRRQRVLHTNYMYIHGFVKLNAHTCLFPNSMWQYDTHFETGQTYFLMLACLFLKDPLSSPDSGDR